MKSLSTSKISKNGTGGSTFVVHPPHVIKSYFYYCKNTKNI